MVIYAEYLFAENFIIGLMIFVLTGKLCGVKPRKSLLVIGAVFCAIYSFTIFLNDVPAPVTMLSKLIFSAVSVELVFLAKKLRPFGKLLMVFYIVSFAMGGITIGFMYFFQMKGVANNSFVYIAEPTYLKVAIGCGLAYGALNAFAGFLREVVFRQNTTRAVELHLDGRSVKTQGFIDTGNSLKDPLSGKPVFVISQKIAKELLPMDVLCLLTKELKWEEIYEKLLKTKLAGRMRLIPYRSVGKAEGMLIGFRADQVTVKDKQGERSMGGIILAISRERFLPGKEAEYDLLLHKDMMEGGMA